MKSERNIRSIPKKIFTIVFSIIFIILQLVFFYLLFFGISALKDTSYQYIYKFIYITVEIIGIIIVLKNYDKNINEGYKLSWTIFILLCPFLGTMCYLLFANGRSLSLKKRMKINKYIENKKPINYEINEIKKRHPDLIKLSNSISNDSYFFPYFNSRSHFFSDITDKNKEMIKDILNAKKYILIEYFIIVDGYLLDELYEALLKKGKEGIEIKILYDAVGSGRRFTRVMKDKLNSIPNLKMYSYEPLGISFNPAVNYRDHRKITIIDGNIAYCGGDNIADEYDHLKVRFGYWRDNCVKIEGDAVYSFLLMFFTMWFMSSKEEIDILKYKGDLKFESKEFIQPFGDGPFNKNNPAYNLFMTLISTAKTSIYISTPYFIIDSEMINTIVRAAKNGIDVKILLPHVPDKKIIYMMSMSFLGSILKAGGKVYEYLPGFNHAKNIIIDGKYSFVGSINMDYRSLILHFESGVLISNSKTVDSINNSFIEGINKSNEIKYLDWKHRNIFLKLFELIFKILSPIL